MAHKEFKEKFKELSLSLSEVEQKIDCPKNYLSQFINGERTLPVKWEDKIRLFLNATKTILARLEAPPPNPDLLRPWIKNVEDYCKSTGIEPETLIEDHKHFKTREQAWQKTLENHKRAGVGGSNLNLTGAHNEAQRTEATGTLSNWAIENRKKKLGLKD